MLSYLFTYSANKLSVVSAQTRFTTYNKFTYHIVVMENSAFKGFNSINLCYSKFVSFLLQLFVFFICQTHFLLKSCVNDWYFLLFFKRLWLRCRKQNQQINTGNDACSVSRQRKPGPRKTTKRQGNDNRNKGHFFLLLFQSLFIFCFSLSLSLLPRS